MIAYDLLIERDNLSSAIDFDTKFMRSDKKLKKLYRKWTRSPLFTIDSFFNQLAYGAYALYKTTD